MIITMMIRMTKTMMMILLKIIWIDDDHLSPYFSCPSSLQQLAPPLLPTEMGPGLKYDFLPEPLKIQTLAKYDSGSIFRLLLVRSSRYRSLNDQNQKIKNQNFWSKKWKKWTIEKLEHRIETLYLKSWNIAVLTVSGLFGFSDTNHKNIETSYWNIELDHSLHMLTGRKICSDCKS